MSRILDYVLEPSVVYTNGSFLVKVKVQDDYKYKKLLISENMKYITATGTTFTLTNAVSTNNASIYQLEGNTTQNGTPTPTTPIPIYTVSGDNEVVVSGKNLMKPIDTSTASTYGITRTTNSDGSITLSGTATANAYLRISDYLTLESNTTYSTINQNASLPTGVTMYYNNNSNIGVAYSDTVISPTGRVKTYTTGTVTGTISIALLIQSGTSFSTPVTLYPMLVKGTYTTSTIPNYAPYQGNSYRVDLGGKNKLPNNITSQTKNGLTVINNGGVITINGTSTAITYLDFTTTLNTTALSGYKFYGFPTDKQGIGIRISTSNRTSLQDITDNGIALNDNGTDKYIAIRIPNNKTVTNYVIQPMLLSPEETNTTYSPYVSNPIELCKIGSYIDKLKRAEGKQLFDKDNMNKLNGYFESNNVITASNYNRIFYIECEPNTTYTIAQNPSTSPISNHLLQVATSSVLPEIGVECTSNHNIGGDTSYTMTTNAEAKYLVFRIRSGDDIDSYLSTIMINYGSTALPYEPYGNNWYIEKNIGMYDSWTSVNRTSTYTNTINYQFVLPLETDTTKRYTALCNYFPNAVNNNDTEHIFVGTSTANVYKGLNVFISKTRVTTSAEAITWLKNNGVKFYYILKNPTYEIITNEGLIEQLNNLQDIELIENLCYVDWVGVEKPTMTLQYPTNETLNAYITTEDNKLIRTDWGV